MKKVLFAAAMFALVSCGNKTTEEPIQDLGDTVAVSVEDTEEEVGDVAAAVAALTPELKAAVENDAEMKALVEKATSGEISDAEKLTLWQKLKKIGGDVVLGNKSAEAGVNEAVTEVKGASAEEVKATASKAVETATSTKTAKEVKEKVTETKAKVEETKQKVENVKATADAVKGALDAFKK